MAFQVSPGVLVQELDLTRVIPAVSTSIGAFAGEFRQGPVDEIVTISSEQQLTEQFGKPDANNFEDYFSVANFLQYTNNVKVVRVTNSGLLNASSDGTGTLIKNTDDYLNNYAAGQGVVGTFAARTGGAWGNNLQVSTCPSATAYEQEGATTVNDTVAVGDTTLTVADGGTLNVGDIIAISSTAATNDYDDGEQYRITGISTHDITIVQHQRGQGGLKKAYANGANVRRRWRYYDQAGVDGAPGTSPYVSDRSGSGDEIHVVVIDEDGGISGVPGTVLEVFSGVSKAADAKTPQGASNYYPDVIYNQSQYVYWMDHNTSGSNWGSNAAGTTFTAVNTPTLESLSAGADGSTRTVAELKTAYDMVRRSAGYVARRGIGSFKGGRKSRRRGARRRRARGCRRGCRRGRRALERGGEGSRPRHGGRHRLRRDFRPVRDGHRQPGPRVRQAAGGGVLGARGRARGR